MEKINTLLLALLLSVSVLTTQTGCNTRLGSFFQQEQVQKIALSAARLLTQLGLDAVADNNPEWKEEIKLAKDALIFTYSTTFSDTTGDGEISSLDVAKNIGKALAVQISDPKVVAQLQKVLARELVGLGISTDSTPQTPVGFDAKAANSVAIALLAISR